MPSSTVTPSPTGPLILLVEDNPLVQATTQALLAALGYQIVTAGDASEAMTQLADHPRIKLLVSDLGLPGNVDGRQLAVRAARLRPGLPVLLTSGSPISEAELRATGVHQLRFLQKPFPIAALQRAIDAQLAEAGPQPAA